MSRMDIQRSVEQAAHAATCGTVQQDDSNVGSASTDFRSLTRDTRKAFKLLFCTRAKKNRQMSDEQSDKQNDTSIKRAAGFSLAHQCHT